MSFSLFYPPMVLFCLPWSVRLDPGGQIFTGKKVFFGALFFLRALRVLRGLHILAVDFG